MCAENRCQQLRTVYLPMPKVSCKSHLIETTHPILYNLTMPLHPTPSHFPFDHTPDLPFTPLPAVGGGELPCKVNDLRPDTFLSDPVGVVGACALAAAACWKEATFEPKNDPIPPIAALKSGTLEVIL